MKVYVIEKGWYSGRHIIGVALSKEDADRIVNAINESKDTRYEVYDTDQFIVSKPFKYKVEYLINRWYAEYEEDDSYYDYIKENTNIYGDTYIIFAHNKDEAIKIAQDMKAEYEAEQKGVKV